jgi:hypothetical protein
VSAGVVATTTGADVKLRRLFAEDSLEVVVSLLAGAFEFYFCIRGGLLLLGQKLARQTNGIPFPKITAAALTSVTKVRIGTRGGTFALSRFESQNADRTERDAP